MSKIQRADVLGLKEAFGIFYTRLHEIKDGFLAMKVSQCDDTYCLLSSIFVKGLLNMANKLSKDAGYTDKRYLFDSEIRHRYPDSYSGNDDMFFSKGIIHIVIPIRDDNKPVQSMASLVGAVASLSRKIKDLKTEKALGTKLTGKTQSIYCDHGNPETDCVSFKVRVSCRFCLKEEEIDRDAGMNIRRADIYTILTIMEYCLLNEDELWNETGRKMMSTLLDKLGLKV